MTSNEVVPSSANEVYEVEHDYDALNRVVAQRVLDNATSTVLTTTPEYDLRHNQVRVTDSIGRVHIAVYDLANRRLTGTEDSTGLSIQTTYQYDLDDLLTVLTDADGYSTSSTYDGKGRTTQVGYETGLFEAYAYDQADRLLTHRTQDGVLTIFSYNADDTLAARTAGTDREEFTWNALNQPKSAESLDTGASQSLLTFAYDGFSRLNTDTQGAYVVGHGYDASHNPTSLTYPAGGPALTSAFDAIERLSSFDDTFGTIVSYQYAGPGRLHQRTTNLAVGTIGQNFDWDGLRRLTGLDAGSVHDLVYDYDDFNRRTFKQSNHSPLNGVGDVFAYDGGSRLSDIAYDAPSPPSDVGAASYLKILQSKVQARTTTTLTAGGPPVVTTWASDALHQTTDIGAVERFYDLKGNLTDDGEGLFYAYDAWNRLTSVSDSTGTLVTYELDALGRRSKRIEASGQTTRYVYSGARLLEEYEASSPSGTFTLKIRYLYGAGLDELVALEDDVGARYFVFQDALGSVEAVTDWNGVVLERYRYDAFGQATVTNGDGTLTHTDAVTGRPKSPLGNSLWFTGARWDPESGNYHMRARQYEPKTGRFVSRDPLGYVDGPNAYTYGFSDPANWTDPMGLEAGGGGGAGGGMPMSGSPMPASFMPDDEDYLPLDAQALFWAGRELRELGARIYDLEEYVVAALTPGYEPQYQSDLAYHSQHMDAGETATSISNGALLSTARNIGISAGVYAAAPLLLGGGRTTKLAVGAGTLAKLRRWYQRAFRRAPAIKKAPNVPKRPPIGLDDCGDVARVGFAPGLGRSAFTPNRLQHASRHLTEEGILGNWSKATGEEFTELGARILENPSATFAHVLRGGHAVRGFLGGAGGKKVAILVYKDGKYQGQVATAIVPSANQLAGWGL